MMRFTRPRLRKPPLAVIDGSAFAPAIGVGQGEGLYGTGEGG
jgi:hypothetical protein